ncbi:MAG: hypothetical protein ACJAYG_002453, partial [Oceanicoccus sp.]
MKTSQQFLYGCALIVLVFFCCWLYWPGLRGMFLLDDIQHLALLNIRGGVTNWDAFITFVFGNHSGPLGRPVAMLSFLLNDQYYPGDIESYRYSNVLFHCLCGVLLFTFVSELLKALKKNEQTAYAAALLVTAWWLLAPFNVSTTLYVIQRMTQLATLFSLAGLVFYLKGRRELLADNPVAGWLWLLAGLLGFGSLAVLSKESGALLFVYALACELTLRAAANDRFKLNALYYVLLIPSLLIIAYLAYKGIGSGGYLERDFSLS